MAVSVFIGGCGQSSDTPSHSVSADQPPEKACEARSRLVDLQGDPEGVALWRAALYDDCMVPYQTDPQQAAKQKQVGQVEALKGALASMVARPSGGAEIAKTKLIAMADLDQILSFFALLKASNKFSDADLQKLDQAFPHLGIGDAFRAYEQRTNAESTPPAETVESMNTLLLQTAPYRCWMKIGNRFQDQAAFRKFNEISSQMQSDVFALKNHSFGSRDEAMKAMRMTSGMIVVYSHVLDDPSLAQVKDFCSDVLGVGKSGDEN
jgi:hypothetical protein